VDFKLRRGWAFFKKQSIPELLSIEKQIVSANFVRADCSPSVGAGVSIYSKLGD
jgi:hypothetical protein